MKKILFLAMHLGYGGAEKAIISEANILVEKYDVEIACTYKLYDKPAFPLDERVKVSYLSETLKPNKEELKQAIQEKAFGKILKEAWRSIQVLHYRTASIKKAVQNSDADIIISTRYLYHKILAKNKKAGVITIAQEHNHHNNDEKYIKQMIQSVKGIDYFMPVSQELTDFYSDKVGDTVCKYIPHALDYMPEQVSKLPDGNLISVGRLAKEKGYKDLIDVFALVAKDYPGWKLHIVGDGDERSTLEQCIEEKQLQSQVVLHGYQSKDYINQLLSDSAIYVMSSYTESFGIVLIEAQSFGIPCIAFDSARGALEIVKDQENGYLIANRDFAAMAEKIKLLIDNPQLRQNLGEKGRENSLQYSEKVIQSRWFDFIDNM